MGAARLSGPTALAFGLSVAAHAVLLFGLYYWAANMSMPTGDEPYVVSLVDRPAAPAPAAPPAPMEPALPVREPVTEPVSPPMATPAPPVVMPAVPAPLVTDTFVAPMAEPPATEPDLSAAPPAYDRPTASPVAPVPSRPAPPAQEERPGPITGPLFPSDVVASVARRPAASRAAEDDAEGVTFNTREVMFQGYMDRLRDRVESVWRYPLEAAKRGIYGDLIIVFTVRRDGTLSDVRVKRTSGHSMLDQAAIEALHEAEPFWPLPDDWGRESLTITGKFIYLNGRYYIR